MTAAPYLTAAAERRRIEQAGEARAAQLATTPQQPTDPVVRTLKEQDDEA